LTRFIREVLSVLVLRTVGVCFLLAALLFGSTAHGPRAGARNLCASISGKRVGVLTSVLHTNVYVAGTNVGAAPCDLVARSLVKTDRRGQAVFRLSRAGRRTKCILLPESRLMLSPASNDQEPVIRFMVGTSWCMTSGDERGFFSPPKLSSDGDFRLVTTKSVFGVNGARRTTVKIDSTSDARGAKLMKVGVRTISIKGKHQATITSTGRMMGPTQAKLDAADRVALARLRAAP
jgi:hypothetical protein